MTVSFTQLMTEIDPNHQLSQLQIDSCYYFYGGTFGSYPNLDNPTNRERWKHDVNDKNWEISQDVIGGHAKTAQTYSNELLAAHLTFPAPTYVATYVV